MDGQESFDVTLLEAAAPRRVVVFGVGSGGDPSRHLPLLESLRQRGCTVVAPHAARLSWPLPHDDVLVVRARRLLLAIDSAAPRGLPVAGVGHSIGGALLLALSGGQMWTQQSHQLAIETTDRIARLALLAPAAGFFHPQGSLDTVRIPVVAWAASLDTITPPAQVELLRRCPGLRDIHVVQGGGHFSFMNSPPPNVPEPLAHREVFLARLAEEVGAFVTG